MKNFKYIFITISAIIIFAILFVKFTLDDYTLISGENVYIGNPWKKLSNEDDDKLEKVIMTSNLYNCKKMLAKNTENGCYILACLNNENKWNYYYAIPNYDAMLLSDEIVEEIDPPK